MQILCYVTNKAVENDGISKQTKIKITQEAGRGETDPLRPTPAADEPGRRMTLETGWKALCDPLPKPETNR